MTCPVCKSEELEKYSVEYDYGVIPAKQGLVHYVEEELTPYFYLLKDTGHENVVICSNCGVVYKLKELK